MSMSNLIRITHKLYPLIITASGMDDGGWVNLHLSTLYAIDQSLIANKVIFNSLLKTSNHYLFILNCVN
jgi:hypothetical protein